MNTPTTGPEAAQEAACCPAEIVGQVAAIDAVAKEIDAGLASRRRAVRQQNPMLGVTRLQRLDERFGRSCLAHRNGVNPDNPGWPVVFGKTPNRSPT